MLPQKGFYYHFKHNPEISINNYAYEILGTAKNSEDNSLNVIYRPLYKNEFLGNADYFARPLNMFLENVTLGDKTLPRFSLIADPELISKLEIIKSKLYNN